ncbi:hypothetical protein [Nitrosomonas sp. Nm34]|uniref:hypothetical protein n=1 Tax=Nitrosomonas sp. Nm34 TaxID=1881055 RepID=UPI0020C87671|nr:hypothetical protein [Nitrosomonas sp. Nm34]
MWIAIEQFGLAKEVWFTELPGLKHGIPSHDTFGKFTPPLIPGGSAFFFPLGC